MENTTIKRFMVSLVHKRFNIETLNAKLSEFFKQPINVEYIQEDTELSDWNLAFDTEHGDFDIYVLKMKNDGLDGSNIYITEVNCEF